MRMLQLARRGAPLLAAAAFAVAGTAHATDIGAIGRSFKVKDSATKDSVAVQSKDPVIVLPAADPASVGATLDISIQAGPTVQTQSYTLDATGWASSSATTKKFKGTVPGIKSIVLKAGQLKIKGEPTLLGLTNAPYNSSKTVLAIGSDRYCIDFTTPALINTNAQLKWSLQPGPGVCPAIPTTSTSTSTSTSTTLPPSCGNGIPETGEECDDGNNIDCDGCDSNCTLSTSCGNGITCAPEQCDGGPGCNGSCESTASSCVGANGQRLVVVSINTPSTLAGVRVDLTYPAIETSLPGSGGSSEVQSRVFTFPTQGISAVNDMDNDLLTVFANTTAFINSGPLFAVNFDECVDVSRKTCNRALTVLDCCNNPADPNQFGNTCARYSPALPCSVDSNCPGPDNTTCTGAGLPYPCCTGAGTGTCTPSSFCTANGVPLGCCQGLGIGTCTGPNGSCVIRCNTNPPVCAPGHFPSDPALPAGPCDNVAGACPGDNECVTQQALTSCSVSNPSDAQGNPVSGVTCSVTIL